MNSRFPTSYLADLSGKCVTSGNEGKKLSRDRVRGRESKGKDGLGETRNRRDGEG